MTTFRATLSPLALTAAVLLAAGSARADELVEAWRTTGFEGPESVAWDGATGAFYVSNMGTDPMKKDGDGYIAIMNRDGQITTQKWVTGLDAPKGVDVVNGKLYTADIDQLVEIDMASATITNRYPVAGAVLLNDVFAAPDGRVFVSDTFTNSIHLLENGKVGLWLSDPALMGVNGLTMIGDKLIAADLGDASQGFDKVKPGLVVSIDMATKAVTPFGSAEPSGVLDGIEPDGAGGVIFTDYMGARIMAQAPGGTAVELGKLSVGSADLEYVADGGLIVVPVTPENAVVALTRK
jgi:DNA-binding beta-propeller fold protein YncE